MGDTINFLLVDAVWLIFKLIGIIMLPILIIGLAVGVFQAATQIQEMTLSFIPKIVILFLIFLFYGKLMTQMWVEFATKVFKIILVI